MVVNKTHKYAHRKLFELIRLLIMIDCETCSLENTMFYMQKDKIIRNIRFNSKR